MDEEADEGELEEEKREVEFERGLAAEDAQSERVVRLDALTNERQHWNLLRRRIGRKRRRSVVGDELSMA